MAAQDGDNLSRNRHDPGDRRSGERSGGRRASDPLPLPITPESLDTLIDALEHFAGAMPAGRALFTAIYDTGAGASDLIIRDQDGDTRLILGLENAQQHRLELLLAWVRGELDPRDPGLAREIAALEPGGARSVPGALTTPEAGAAEPGSSRLDYRAILEQSPFPLLVISAAEQIEYASPAVVTRLGMRDPAQLQGMSLADVVHPGDWSAVSRLIESGAEEDDPTVVRLVRWDGLHSRAEINVYAMDGTGQVMLALEPVEGGVAGSDRGAAAAGAARWQMRTNTEVSALQR